jgi:hypothetical protein
MGRRVSFSSAPHEEHHSRFPVAECAQKSTRHSARPNKGEANKALHLTVESKRLHRVPGTTYERFSFDTFRVRGGKLAEHWDDEEITTEAVQALKKLEQ